MPTESSYLQKILDKGWYFTKTLLACDPDTNKRMLYLGADKIVTMNDNMVPWSKEMDAKLQQACDLLNEIQGIKKP